MGFYHIADGDQWNLVITGLIGDRIHTQRAGSTVTRADYIGANDKVLLGVNNTSCTYYPLPPIGRIGVGGKGMTYPNHVVFGGI